MSESEREFKRQRVSEPEIPVIMDVNCPAKWDFLAPWCEELNGQLIAIHENVIRVLGPRHKREKPIRFDLEDEEEEEIDPVEEEKEIEEGLWRTREAIELLSLVAKVDQKAFHMLITEQCGLRLDEEESEDEEEEFRAPMHGDEDGDFIFSDFEESEEEDEDEESEEEEEEEENGEEEEALGLGGIVRHIDDEDDVIVLPVDTSNSERRQQREQFLLPRFDFISLSGLPGMSDPNAPPTEEWERLFLADTPQYQPSEEYKKAQARILDMQSPNRLGIQQSIEIPVSLEFGSWASSADQQADYLEKLNTVMRAMKERAQKLKALSQKRTDCASTFIYHLVEISIMLRHKDDVSTRLAECLCEVLGNGVPVGELRMCLTGLQKDGDQISVRENLAKLLSGILIRPLSPIQLELPCFSNLEIDCCDSTLWELEALCAALAVARAPIQKLRFSGGGKYHTKDEFRGRYWKLVAQTFFHPSSSKGPFPSVRGLEISDVNLTGDDLGEITTALQEKEHHAVVTQQWDICQKSWFVRKNTMVQFRKDKSSLVDGAVKLPHDSFVHLVQSDSEENTDDNQNDWLDVIVPAYGQCRVPRESVVAVSPEDEKVTGKPMGEPLISLSLSLRSESDGLKGLLEQIGWSLQKLSLGFYREVDVNSMVPSILKSCPKMTQLALDESFIDLDRFSTVYEGSNSSDDKTLPAISILKFQDYYGIGEGEGKLFMKRLGDPTTRLAKHLRELTIQAEEYADPLEHPTLAELSIALGKNTTLEKVEVLVSRTLGSAMMKRRLRQFDGQVLPPRPLPLSCKLAFLSVAQPKESGDMKPLPALQRLDQRVISRVLEFAATFVVRSVKVYG